jgi:hypothetical protein
LCLFVKPCNLDFFLVLHVWNTKANHTRTLSILALHSEQHENQTLRPRVAICQR